MFIGHMDIVYTITFVNIYIHMVVLFTLRLNWDTWVMTVTGYRLVGQTSFLFPGSSRSCYIASQLVKTGSGTDPSSCPLVPEIIVPGVKSSFSAKVKNLWSFISVLTYAYMAWCLDTGTMFTAMLTAEFWSYDWWKPNLISAFTVVCLARWLPAAEFLSTFCSLSLFHNLIMAACWCHHVLCSVFYLMKVQECSEKFRLSLSFHKQRVSLVGLWDVYMIF
jgi:hypothetical protein